jgi:hypothetical protein
VASLGAARRQLGRIVLARWLFEVLFVAPVLPLLAAGVTALAAAVGLLASREEFRSTPLEALREE